MRKLSGFGLAVGLVSVVVACGASDSRRVPNKGDPDGGDAGNGDSSAPGSGGTTAGGGNGAATGGTGSGTGGVVNGAGGAVNGAGGDPGGSGGASGDGGPGTGGAGGGGTVDYCTVGQCPVAVHAMFGLTQASAVAAYRAESGGPFWHFASPPPAGAACFCAINEFSDIPCTTDDDCDESTCNTATQLCVKAGQHDHGPYPYPTLEPVAAFSLQANFGTGGPGFWGDHGTVGTNCPFPHLHSNDATMGSPPTSTGEEEPDHPDPFRDECGHGGLVWIDAAGDILTGPGPDL